MFSNNTLISFINFLVILFKQNFNYGYRYPVKREQRSPDVLFIRSCRTFGKITICCLLFLITLSFDNAYSQVNVSGAVSGNGSFFTLAAATTGINAVAQTGANIVITITGNTAEPVGGAAFIFRGWNSLIIKPSGGAARTISNSGSFLILLSNACQKVTIDGLNTGGNSLTLTNTSTSSSAQTCTVGFDNDASNNVVTNCTILGSSTTATGTDGGTVWFGDFSTGNGNDNNRVISCNIGPAGSNLPTKAVYFGGTPTPTTRNNSSDTIRNCNIYDYFHAVTQSAGVYINSGSTDIAINNNKFYQTALRTQTTGTLHAAVLINNTSGNNFAVSGNTIGYSSGSGTGQYSFAGTSGSILSMIDLNVGTSVISSIQGNTISNISVTGSSSGTGTAAPFRGIHVASGLTQVGNITGNTIGSMTANNNISFSSSSASVSNIYGISNLGTSNWTTNNNKIVGITTSNSGGSSSNIYGMICTSTGSWTCSGNTIGSDSLNSIMNTSTAANAFINGITNLASSTAINNNLIQNLSVAGGSGTGINGSIIGIVCTSASDHNISKNVIGKLTNTSSSLATVVTGIYYLGGSGTNLVERNKIYSLNISSNTSVINGINVQPGGIAAFQNNMIQLGTTFTGAGVNKGCLMRGVIESGSGANNYYNNSIYIGGDPTEGSSDTYCFNSSIITSTRNFKNNIFYNSRSNNGSTGKHYAVTVGGSTPNPPGLSMNYNIYLSNGNGGYIGLYNGFDITDFAGWQTAVGQDANSYNTDPGFLNPDIGDLHLSTTPVTFAEGRALPIATVVNDLDGNTKNLSKPDVGADEGNFIYAGVMVGSNKNYNTLSEAFSYIDSNNYSGVDLVVLITNNTTEPTSGAELHSGSWNSLTIKPYGGQPRTISGAAGQDVVLVKLNGCDNVRIDGLNTGGNSLTISNTTVSSSTGTRTISLENAANYNSISRCTIYGSGSSGGGVIYIEGYDMTNTMDTISYCNIGTLDQGQCTRGILYEGLNSNQVVSNCNIFDYFVDNGGSFGIHVSGSASNFNIINNRFYQTQLRTSVSGYGHHAITLGSTNGNNFTISGNIIGYGSAAGTGLYAYNGILGGKISMIYVDIPDSSTVSIQGNTIDGISTGGSLDDYGFTTPAAIAIHVHRGKANVTGNTIGSMTATGSITHTSNAPYQSTFAGIVFENFATPMNTSNNNIGGIYAASSNDNIAGIVNYYSRSTNWICQNNIIGGDIPNSLQTAGDSYGRSIIGIANIESRNPVITGNTIRNFTCTGGSATDDYASLIGILIQDTSTNVVTQNTIQNLSSTNGGGNTVVTGIYFTGTYQNMNTVSFNNVSSLSVSSNSAFIYGIQINGGTTNYFNNMISLGSSVTKGSLIAGIYERFPSSGYNFSYNSVYVSGITSEGSSNTYCLLSIYNGIRSYKNNIFYNARSNSGSSGKHYSFSIGNNDNMTSNYNDLFVSGSGGVLARSSGTDRTNLSQWRSVTGGDSASISSDPKFISSTNLRIDTNVYSPVDNAGTYIAGISTDYDGNTRSVSTPDIGADEFTGHAPNINLNLTMFIEGFYNSSSNTLISDTVKAYLRSSSSPYAIVDSAKAILSSAGNALLAFSNAVSGNYYMMLKHRNSLETWSSSAASFTQGGTTNYNFTSSSSQAYGNNMKQIDTAPLSFGVFSGDVNQDGLINLNDIISVSNASSSFANGYVVTDVNGDNITNLNDILITYNNSAAFVSKATP